MKDVIKQVFTTLSWIAFVIVSFMALVWVCKNILPRISLLLKLTFKKIQALYFDLYERRRDTSLLVKEAKAAWMETRKKNEAMFDKRDRSRIRVSFLESELKELTYYLALKTKTTKKEKERLRELRKQIGQVNNA